MKDHIAAERGRSALQAIMTVTKSLPEKGMDGPNNSELYLLHMLRKHATGEENPRTRITEPQPPAFDDSTAFSDLIMGVYDQTPAMKCDIAAYLVEKYQPQIKILNDAEYKAEKMESCRKEIDRDFQEEKKLNGLHQILLCAETGPLAAAPEHGFGMLKYPNGARVNYMMTEHFHEFVNADGTLREHGRNMLTYLQETRGPSTVTIGSDGFIKELSKNAPVGSQSRPSAQHG